MSLENLQEDLESIDGVELANDGHINNYKGTVIHLTLTEGQEGDGDELVDEILDTIPRDFMPLEEPEESQFDSRRDRITVYYDAIDILL